MKAEEDLGRGVGTCWCPTFLCDRPNPNPYSLTSYTMLMVHTEAVGFSLKHLFNSVYSPSGQCSVSTQEVKVDSGGGTGEMRMLCTCKPSAQKQRQERQEVQGQPSKFEAGPGYVRVCPQKTKGLQICPVPSLGTRMNKDGPLFQPSFQAGREKKV